MSGAAPLQDILRRWQWWAAIVAVSAGVPSGLAAVTNVEQFLQSYLVAFLFWWSTSMGCLGLLMLYHLVGGRWGAAARPFLESGSATTLPMAALFVPIALGLEQLYPWTSPGAVSEEKALYLNAEFFLGRAVLYFVVWSILALVLRRPSAERGTEQPRWLRLTSAGGLVVLVLTVTFAAIDWGMSLDPKWFSSIYGAVFVIGGALAAMALVGGNCAALEWTLRPTTSLFPAHILADLATLMLAFLMLWAYFSFSQFLIIWSGNLPEENVWYVDRLRGGWQWVGVGLVVFQFFVPFFLLLSRDLKQSPRSLVFIAMLVLAMHAVEMLWTVSPSFHPRDFSLHWADAVVFVSMGGFWLSADLWILQRHSHLIIARRSHEGHS